jgi:CRP/FNR family cyclic AMP-dependent transcriptional regulator
MSNTRQLKKGDTLFREGDPSEAMYVIKSGKLAIMKSKGSSEVLLAELGAGDMVGEMAFFDNKPRSATARAASDSDVIELPFKALNAQFQTFPEWLKAIVRTVNIHLRNANLKIKTLEKTAEEETVYFHPHLLTRLCSILGFVAHRYGEPSEGGTLIPPNRLRNTTIQIFQQPTAKMDKLIDILQSLGHMKREDLGEGRVRLVVYKKDLFLNFADFYNEWLFKTEDKKVTIEDKEVRTLRALSFYGSKVNSDAKGLVRVNLTAMQGDSLKDLGFPFDTDEVNSLSEKKVTAEKMSGDGGKIFLTFNLAEIQTLHTYWEIIHACEKVRPE